MTTTADPTTSTQPTPQTPAQIKQSHFDLAISLTLHLWPALTSAVQNSWGGPDSTGKRDWFAGAISDLFIGRPDTDQEDLECVLLQIMEDEFDARLEDESEVDVAGDILLMRKHCEKGNFGPIEKMQRRWEERMSKKQAAMAEGEAESQDVDEDDSDFDDEDGGVEVDMDGDEEMGDVAPQLVPREKVEPEIDEDGFQKVVGKKKR